MKLRQFLRGRIMPKGVRKGTWIGLIRGTTDDIEHDDLIALVEAVPDCLIVIGIPAMGFDVENQTG